MEENYLENIRGYIISEQARTIVRDYNANKSKLETNYNIGKELAEAGKHYGEGIIKKYSERLTLEFGKGYSTRNLKYMRNFYNFQKGQTMFAQLTWNHYLKLLPLKDINEIKFSIQKDSFRNKYVEVDIDQDIFEGLINIRILTLF